MKYLLLFQINNGFVNTPQCYIYLYIARFVSDIFARFCERICNKIYI